MPLTTEELLLLVDDSTPTKKTDNTVQFMNFMELTPSETRVPFYVIYWMYKKWCVQNKVKYTKVVTKHILSRALGYFFKKVSTYPKAKRFGVRVDYQMMVYVDSPFLPLTLKEEELAFKYYHYLYDQDRSKRKELWKAKKRKGQKEVTQISQD